MIVKITSGVMKDRRMLLAFGSAFVFIIAMVVISDVTHTHEFILPEFAAMAVAMWAFRDANWLRQPINICLAPTITSLTGFAVNQMPLIYLIKVVLTLFAMLLVLAILKSNFAPSLATGLLPLVTDAHDWTLVLLVFLLSLFFMVVVLVFQLNKNLDHKPKQHVRQATAFFIIMVAWLVVCWLSGSVQLAAIPPVIVVAYEAIHKREYSKKSAFKQGFSLTLSATIGTLLFLKIPSWPVVVIIDILLMLLLSQAMRVRMPALYAFPLFPFILPGNAVHDLPLMTLLASLFTFTCLSIYKNRDAVRGRIPFKRHKEKVKAGSSPGQ
ncbi:hypothetical protein BRE01_36770 [Brevibacillus reuszeri]|uniref:HPP transmembrane region domain-containing protein n=1 Tax=Brevibacillus reuszeri TaxID=54915 RepID=A0ABQ0TPT9_9BACL|nr:HPP family protein [Brevibacillus reuszeri]MED1861430.1 HPP family protein [Brevibacillus reuszeri]GED69975.1 hypothetical protein BRE01_36770 [Brevibacillus reuszeri]